jgi:hypothetical protein
LSPTGRSFVPTPYTLSPVYSTLPLTYGGHFSSPSNPIVGFTPPAAQYNSPYSVDSSGHTTPGYMPSMTSWSGVETPSPCPPRGSPMGRFSAKRQNASRGGSRSPYANSQVGQHNVVDVDRIRAGLDVRTTVIICFNNLRDMG